jgi:hypothetical protein
MRVKDETSSKWEALNAIYRWEVKQRSKFQKNDENSENKNESKSRK